MIVKSRINECMKQNFVCKRIALFIFGTSRDLGPASLIGFSWFPTLNPGKRRIVSQNTPRLLLYSMLYHLNYLKHWRLVLWNVTQYRLVTVYWRPGWATYLYLQGIPSHSSWTILKMEQASSLETLLNNYHIWHDTIYQKTLICISRPVKTQNHSSPLSGSQPLHTHTQNFK